MHLKKMMDIARVDWLKHQTRSVCVKNFATKLQNRNYLVSRVVVIAGYTNIGDRYAEKE